MPPEIVLPERYVTFGCDPELFISRDGHVVESAEAVPSHGIITGEDAIDKIVRDGVQVELNPAPSSCRALLGNSIHRLMVQLKGQLDEKGLKADFRPVITLSAEELAAMDANARQLGCAPSNNKHNSNAKVLVADGFGGRSAGGHLHFGNLGNPGGNEKYIPLLDTIVGNFCVMLEPGPEQAERRKVYGRAGEYRIPGTYRLEYRTPSNFWLRAYPLMSMILGFSRVAIQLYDDDHEQAILKMVDLQKVVEAINTNNHVLARENWEALKPFLSLIRLRHPGEKSDSISLHQHNLVDIDFFLSKPVTEWFPLDPMTYWTTQYTMPAYHGGLAEGFDTGHYGGWENFLWNTVRPAREAAQKAAEKDLIKTLVAIAATTTKGASINA